MCDAPGRGSRGPTDDSTQPRSAGEIIVILILSSHLRILVAIVTTPAKVSPSASLQAGVGCEGVAELPRRSPKRPNRMLPKGRAAKATPGSRTAPPHRRAGLGPGRRREDERRGNTVDVEVVELGDGADEAGPWRRASFPVARCRRPMPRQGPRAGEASVERASTSARCRRSSCPCQMRSVARWVGSMKEWCVQSRWPPARKTSSATLKASPAAGRPQ
jgi:hypothetical protein